MEERMSKSKFSLFTILSQLIENIVICLSQSYEIVFINPAAEKLFQKKKVLC
jgi:nitrogen-specific signal transduction histidine kinase